MPEIETIARKLRKAVVGKLVAEVRLSGFPLRKPIADTFAPRLRGRTIRRIHRRGKYLIVEMEPRAYWIIHLGMSGRVLYHSPASARMKHTHAIVQFADSSELEYRDHRRFGLLAAYEMSRLGQIPEIRSLGRDPLSSRFNEEWLWSLLQRSRQEIKAFLLDQHKVAGLGNIYVCEALFEARINPLRRCFNLSREEAARLVHAIQRVVRTAIRHHGTSFSDFMDSDGEPGENQSYLSVFQREGKQCSRCRTRVQRLRQGNRSSFFCPRCQE